MSARASAFEFPETVIDAFAVMNPGLLRQQSAKRNSRKKGKVKLCGSCMDARGLNQEMMVKKAERSTMEELAELTANADQVMVF